MEHCMLNTAIAQMQRELLRVKEQRELMPAALDFGLQGKSSLKLLIRSEFRDEDDEDEPQQSALTSVSCVLSSEGELLCIDNTTAGITGEGLRSLGFVVPGQTMYRVLESDEVRRVAARAIRGGAQLFGCCVSVYPRPQFPGADCHSCGDAVGRSEVRDVCLYSWLEEELETLFDYLDHWTQGNRGVMVIDRFRETQGSDSFASQERELSSQQQGSAQLFIELGRRVPDPSSLSAGQPCGTEQICEESRKQLGLQRTSSTGAKLKARSEQLPSMHDISSEPPIFGSKQRQHKQIESAWCTEVVAQSTKNLLIKAFIDSSSTEVKDCNSESKAVCCVSVDAIFEHAEWLLSLALELDENPGQQHLVFCKAFTRHIMLVNMLLDSLRRDFDSSNVSLKDDSVIDKSFGLDPDMTCHVSAMGSNFGGVEQQINESSSTTLNPAMPEAVPISAMEQLKKSRSGVILDTFSQSEAELKWELLVEHLVETHGLYGWQRFQQSFLGLPEEINALYDHLESDEGRIFNKAERNRYYNAFYKKASGASVINTLQMEELIHQQIEVGDANLQEMTNNLPVNNGLFDFKSFIWLLSAVMRFTEVSAQQNKIACWKYWYNRLIPVHPDAVPKQLWDLLVLLLLIYSCFQVPYSMAFDDPGMYSDKTSVMFAVDVLLDVIFMVDVSLCFLTAFYDSKGMLVRDLKEIGARYCKSWFLPDIGGSFPFDNVVSLFLEQSGNVGALRILKLVRLLKLLRAVRVFRALNALGNREGLGALKNVIGIFRSLFALVFVAHVLGCFFVMLIPDNPRDNWLIDYQPSLMQADDWTRYITCLYWAIISITTMGYGDIKPENGEERIYVIFVALAGAITFSFCMGTISSLIANVTGSRFRIMEKEADVTEYLHFRELSSQLKAKIRTHYRLSWRKSGDLFKESQILCDLSSTLRKSALEEIGEKSKMIIPLFQGFDDECIGYIFTRLKRVDFMEGDTIYKKGDNAAEMYLVGRGAISIHFGKIQIIGKQQNENHTNSACKVIEAGGTFGELAIFPDLLPPVRYETALANSWVVAYVLDVEELPALEKKYPLVTVRLREFCRLKIADGLARGHLFQGRDNTKSHAGGSLKHCKLKTMIAQMQRNLLQVKQQSELMLACGVFWQNEKKLLKLLIRSKVGDYNDDEGHNDENDEPCLLTSVSCVLSSQGELLCIEHNTAGITGEGLKSLGFIVRDCSRHSILENYEVLELVGKVGKGGAQLFGCHLLVFDSQIAATGPAEDCGRDMFLYSWLEEELETLLKVLDAYHHSPSIVSCVQLNTVACAPLSTSPVEGNIISPSQ